MRSRGPGRPSRPIRAVARLLACLGVLVAVQLATPVPALAHAELLASSPRDGQELQRPPSEVTLEFSEPVGLVAGGFELAARETGSRIRTAAPVADGSFVHWPMPSGLPDGGYLVRWRVVSVDGHPLAGAFTFGVRAAAGVAGGTTTPWSWPVAVARWLGYLGFAVVAGVQAFTWWCWVPGRRQRRVRRLLDTGLAVAVTGTVLGLLLQGPYTAGLPATRLLDPALVSDVLGTGFGAWMLLRLSLLLAVAAMLWAPGGLESARTRWLAAAGTVAVAATFSGTGHAAASGRLVDRLVDSMHVLAAGVWVGGLVTLVVLASVREGRPTLEAFARFSRVALASFLALTATGVLNALLRLSSVDLLWGSAYGRLLLAKGCLVLAVLFGAATSRTLLRSGQEPWRSVRFEAVVTVAVLALSAALSLTSPSAP